MIFADKLSGIQLVTFLTQSAQRYSTKFTIDTPHSLVSFVVEFEIAEEWHVDFL
jgi:hypothetical protein